MSEQRYTVNLSTGEQHTWVGDMETAARYINDTQETLVVSGGELAFLRCQGGTLINLAHVVSLVPVG